MGDVDRRRPPFRRGLCHLRKLRRRAYLSQHRQRRHMAKPRWLRPDRLSRHPGPLDRLDPDDQQRLYLGTDLGVMVSIDGGHTWMTEETGFGPAVTMWLSLVRRPAGQRQLFAFTHGRGVWRVTLR